MSKSKQNKDTSNNGSTCWRAFNITMPEELVPLYDFLNKEYNRILSNQDFMKKIKELDPTIPRGDYWKALRNIIGNDFQHWKLGANAWYARMIFENIRRLAASGLERRTVFVFLIKHNCKSSKEFWEELHNNNCYPTIGVVRNVQREIDNGDFTEIPTEATFVMDFSTVSDKAIEKKISENRWLFRLNETKWLDLEILLPNNVRKQATGKIAKPRFVKRKRNGQYIGCVSYELATEKPPNSSKIMGVDLGKVKPFSACVVDENGDVSVEYLASKKVVRLIEKFDYIEQNIGLLKAKQSRCQSLVKSVRYDRRETEIEQLRLKRRNLRTEIVRLLAFDIVSVALKEKVREIHVEDLSWLESRGGRWNHSEILRVLEDEAIIHGLKVVKVNASYSSVSSPFDGEIGIENGRKVRFSDGWEEDRDVLSDVNLACRCSEKEKNKKKRTCQVNESFKQRKQKRGCRVKTTRKRECKGASNNNKNNNNSSNNKKRSKLDYSKIFIRGGVDVVALSVGVGDASLPANFTIGVANTIDLAENVRNLNISNVSQCF